MEYSIKHHEGYLELKLWGKFDIEKVEDIFNTITSHEAWGGGILLLVDETDLDSSPLNSAGIQKIALSFQSQRLNFGASKFAVYVSRDLEYGMNRMWGALIEGKTEVKTSFFRSREEAVAWLLEEK
jgi:hypothetical protein